MVKICPTNFCRKCISRIIGNFEMPKDASVVGIKKKTVFFFLPTLLLMIG